MKLLTFCGVIYITIYWHLFDNIIYRGNKAVYISWIDATKLAHNSCKPVQYCYVNNNINLAQNRPKIMEKPAHHQKNIHVQNHAPITPADCHVKIEYFVHVS